MDEYDEFGNYIGADVSDVEEEFEESNNGYGKQRQDDVDDENDDDEYDGALIERADDQRMDVVEENRIILHEDKKYYPDAEEMYPGVRAVTLDEDAQDLNEPIIKPVKQKVFSVLEKEPPKLKYETEFMTGLMQTPALIRNIALLGQFHHGKTSFADLLVQATHEQEWEPAKEVRYADSRKDEQERHLSIKSNVLSLVLDDLKEKSYFLNVVDTPGHVNFTDEATAGIRSVDGAVVIVDAIEGVMLNTERLLKQAVAARLPITLVINKMDRLILELKLPPADAYFKLIHTIEEVNGIIANHALSGSKVQRISPELGNVCFASSQHGWSFTLDSFAQLYVNRHKSFPFSAADLGKRLWGDWFLNPRNNALTKNKPKEGSPVRTFVSFILEPLYKIYSHVVGESSEDLMVLFRQLGIRIKGSEFHLDPRPLLVLSLRRFFGPPQGFVSMIARHIPAPVDAAAYKVETCYTGMQTTALASSMKRCSSGSDAPLMANVTKLYNSPDGTKFHALTRIYSGTVRVGQRVKVLGEAYTEDDDEDMAVMEITGIAVSLGRFNIEVTSAIAGNLVLISGIDHSIKKTATLCDVTPVSGLAEEAPAIFAPLKFDTSSVIKLAVEPFIPSELPKMVEALRRINKTYPLVTTKVEESGEHIILGTGELYMDCIMHDLRHLYSDIEIKVADPVVSFCETVAESSSINCICETPNKKNTLTMLAEPLDDGLGDDIERHHRVSMHWDAKRIGDFFRSNYDWDLLTARSVWAFGPEEDSPNILLNNTLPSEVNQGLLSSVKDSVVQGFRWGAREGPLCDEPIRNVKFRVLDAQIATEPIYRGGGQIIPTSRRAVYSSFLMGTPRLMEPMLLVEIQAPADAVQALYPVLARRRGHIVQDTPKPGAPFYTVKAFLPAMDRYVQNNVVEKID